MRQRYCTSLHAPAWRAHRKRDVARLAASEGLLIRHVSQVQARGGALEFLGAANTRAVSTPRKRLTGGGTHQAIALLVERGSGGSRVALHDRIVEAQPLTLVHAQLLSVEGSSFLVVVVAAGRGVRKAPAKGPSSVSSNHAYAPVGVTGAGKRAARAVLFLLFHPCEAKVGRVHRDPHNPASGRQERAQNLAQAPAL